MHCSRLPRYPKHIGIIFPRGGMTLQSKEDCFDETMFSPSPSGTRTGIPSCWKADSTAATRSPFFPSVPTRCLRKLGASPAFRGKERNFSRPWPAPSCEGRGKRPGLYRPTDASNSPSRVAFRSSCARPSSAILGKGRPLLRRYGLYSSAAAELGKTCPPLSYEHPRTGTVGKPHSILQRGNPLRFMG